MILLHLRLSKQKQFHVYCILSPLKIHFSESFLWGPIPADGVYGLFINSDDGRKMVLDETGIVVKYGIHPMREKGEHYPLGKGYHKLRIEYFHGEGRFGLEFRGELRGNKNQLFHPPGCILNDKPAFERKEGHKIGMMNNIGLCCSLYQIAFMRMGCNNMAHFRGEPALFGQRHS
jgi:hypothetical protein